VAAAHRLLSPPQLTAALLLRPRPRGPGRAPQASPIPGPSLDFVFVVHQASRLQRYITMFLPSIQELTLFSIHPQTKGSAKVIEAARRGTGARRGKA
jgi:hypothetical protein